MSRGRFLGVMEALLVTFLWSSSYILVKIGLDQIQIPRAPHLGGIYCPIPSGAS